MRGHADFGIFVGFRKVTVEDSAIIGNGAGISLLDGSLRLIRSTVASNGGGIYGDPARAVIESSTISGNDGEGVRIGNGRVRILRSTIVGNGSQDYPGGLNVAGRVVLGSTILADNMGGDCRTSFGSGTLRSLGDNLIEDTGNCPLEPELIRFDATDILGFDPMLGPLADNGGPTPTHALLPGSPAIGVIDDPAICRQPDQRGIERELPCDIGAFEAP